MSSGTPERWGLRSFKSTNRPQNTFFLLLGFTVLTGVENFLLLKNSATANPIILPTVKAAAPVSSDIARQRLLGQWLTKDPQAREMMIFLFSTDSKFFIISDSSSSGEATACQFQYQINTRSQPMQLDIIWGDGKTVQTVFEFTLEGDLRVQMRDTQSGKPRPTALANNATQLQKISDETTLPPNTQIKKGCT